MGQAGMAFVPYLYRRTSATLYLQSDVCVTDRYRCDLTVTGSPAVTSKIEAYRSKPEGLHAFDYIHVHVVRQGKDLVSDIDSYTTYTT